MVTVIEFLELLFSKYYVREKQGSEQKLYVQTP